MAFETVYDNGVPGDGRWIIERDDETGRLYLTVGERPREPVTPALYRGWTGPMLDNLREGLAVHGVDGHVADEYMRQAQIWM